MNALSYHARTFVFGIGFATLTPMTGGCEDDSQSAQQQAMDVRIYGEEFIEEGISAQDLQDGWSLHFDHFIVDVQEITVAGVPFGDPAPLNIAVPTQGQGQVLSTAPVPTGSHTHSSFSIVGLQVTGTARKDGVTKSFDWSFEQATHYNHCESTTLVVPVQDPAQRPKFEITVHADHLFYDSLVAEEPRLLFQPLADADRNGDSIISKEELLVTDIGGYDPGSAGGVDNLWAWLIAQSRTLGHVDGEGHCHAQARTF